MAVEIAGEYLMVLCVTNLELKMCGLAEMLGGTSAVVKCVAQVGDNLVQALFIRQPVRTVIALSFRRHTLKSISSLGDGI